MEPPYPSTHPENSLKVGLLQAPLLSSIFYGVAFAAVLLAHMVLAHVAVAGDVWVLSEREKSMLDKGQLVMKAVAVGDAYVKEVQAYLRIKAPPTDVFKLITDYDQLPEFMPNLERTQVLSRDDKGARVNYYLALPFNVKKRYRLQLSYDRTLPDLRMSWQSIPWDGVKPEETVKDTVGFWQLTAVNDDETLLHYYTKTDPGHVPFGLGWIVDYLTKKAVIELLENTRSVLNSSRNS